MERIPENSADSNSSLLMKQNELRKRVEISHFLRNARKASIYAKNLSASARKAGISPSYLCKIEYAEVSASAQVYAELCRVYGIPAGPIYRITEKLDPKFERRIAQRMDALQGVLEELLELRDEHIPSLLDILRGMRHGRSESDKETCRGSTVG